MIDLPYPNINGENNEKKFEQINNYLIQLKDILEFTLMSMSDENRVMSQSLEKGLSSIDAEIEDNLSQVNSLKIGAGDVSISLNDSEDELNLTGNRVTIDSDNFKLSKEGKVTASDITIEGGNINLVGDDTTPVFTISAKDGHCCKFYPMSFRYYDSIGRILVALIQGMQIGMMSYNADGSLRGQTTISSTNMGTTGSLSGGSLTVDGNATINGTTTLASSPVIGSDRDLKDEIAELDAQKSSEFIYSLKPCEYKYKDGTRLHHGFIAQEVKESMGADDWGVYVDSGEHKALRYEEIIADLVATVQAQNERIKALEEKL